MNNLYRNKRTMKVTSEPVTIDDKDLRDCVFHVPLYQREYSWDLEQISDLFEDIENSSEGDEHFLGSILLFAKDEVNREIIDGQQRLTTIFLILFSLRTALKKIEDENDKRVERGINIIDSILYQRSKKAAIIDTGNEPRLTTGKRDKKLFRAILKGEEVENIKDGNIKDRRRKSHKLLLNALYNFIDNKVEKIVKADGATGLLNFLDKVTSCEYIVMTAEKKEDQILLFKTLNSRGRALSESDLIKNEVCKDPKGGTTDEEAVQLWDEMREILEKSNANVDSFLFHYINSLPDAQSLRKEIDTKITVKKKGDNYPPIPEKFINTAYDKKLKSISNTSTFLEGLKFAASNYVDIYTPADTKEKAYIYLTGLRAMNITKCYPLLLRGKEILSPKNFELLAKALECISFRHYILKKEPKELEKFYYSIISKLNSDTDIQIVIDDIKQHSSVSVKSEDKFKKEFEVAAPKSNISKMILARIVMVDSENINVNWQSKDVHLEHIMPQTPKNEWLKLRDKDAELYELSLNRLGNLTLLKGKINMGISNNNFSEKKIGYEKSRLNINHDILASKKWDFDTIDDRQTKLYDLAKDIWVI